MLIGSPISVNVVLDVNVELLSFEYTCVWPGPYESRMYGICNVLFVSDCAPCFVTTVASSELNAVAAALLIFVA